MNHGIMRFMGYTLNHNPHTIEVTDVANISEEVVVFALPVVFNIGSSAVTVKGEGVFYGENAFDQYLELRSLYKKCEVGVLSLSGINPFNAYLAKLELKCTPKDNYVEYKFMFIEVPDAMPEENSTAPEFYIADNDEDLWDISLKCDVSIETLVKLNPHIKNPCCISEGDKIRIREVVANINGD